MNLKIEDWFLKFLQRRCQHPEEISMMNKDEENTKIIYCGRCGILRKSFVASGEFITIKYGRF